MTVDVSQPVSFPDFRHNHRPAEPDLPAAARAAREFLQALGVDCDTPGTLKSPQRMAQAYAELLSPRPFQLTTFPNDEGYDELVVVRSIPVQSVCEHHLLPFFGKCHVAYLPKKKVVGLSKVARLVNMYARRLQIQERLTHQIATALQEKLDPAGVGVIIEARHLCMVMRGVEKQNSTTTTSAMLGDFRENKQTRDEFLSLVSSSRR